MNLKNDGLTVGELSITIATLIIIGFIWTNLTKDKGNEEVSMIINNSSEAVHPKAASAQYEICWFLCLANVTRSDNYNFAIKGSTVKQFLDTHNILTTPANPLFPYKSVPGPLIISTLSINIGS